MEGRFKAVLSDDPKRGSIYDLIDMSTGDVVAWDGGEPEDQTLGRDWAWVPELLNRVAAEGDATTARVAEVSAILSERYGAGSLALDVPGMARRAIDDVAALVSRAEKAEAERDEARRVLLAMAEGCERASPDEPESRNAILAFVPVDRALGLDDADWCDVAAALRDACGVSDG